MDTIANMLSTIKNASMVGKEFVEVPYSKAKEEVAKVLESAGYISKVKVFKQEGGHKGLHMDLVYTQNGKPKITKAKRISKPGRRIYRGYSDLKTVKPEYGVVVVSTSRGVMNSTDAARQRLGGEVICEIA